MQLIMDTKKTLNQEAGSKRKAEDANLPDKNPPQASETSSVGDSAEEDRRKLEENPRRRGGAENRRDFRASLRANESR